MLDIKVGYTLSFDSFPFNEPDFQGNSLQGRKVALVCLGPISLRDLDHENDDKEAHVFAVCVPDNHKDASGEALKFIKSKYPQFKERVFLYFGERVLAFRPERLETVRKEFMLTGVLNEPALRQIYMGYFAHQTLPYGVLRNIKRNFTGARIRKLPMPNEEGYGR